MKNPFDIKEIILLVALFIVGGGWFGDRQGYEAEKARMEERERMNVELIRSLKEDILQPADSIYIIRIYNADSINKKRHENDTITYRFSGDSLLRKWSERFGDY